MSNKLTSDSSTRNSKSSSLCRHQGFSLIELLTSLAVISILLFVGVPSITKMAHDHKVRTAAQDLLTAIQTTRTLAVMKHKRAVLRAKDEWHHGWELFIDNNDNGKRDASEQLILEQEALGQFNVTTTKAMKSISFIATGESRQAKGSTGGSFLAGTLNICSIGKDGYKLILARGGRTRISKTSCS